MKCDKLRGDILGCDKSRGDILGCDISRGDKLGCDIFRRDNFKVCLFTDTPIFQLFVRQDLLAIWQAGFFVFLTGKIFWRFDQQDFFAI